MTMFSEFSERLDRYAAELRAIYLDLYHDEHAYHADPIKRDDSRYLHRGSFDWDAAARRENNPIYLALRRLETLRRTEKAFHPDADVWTLEPQNNHILAIVRYYDGEKLLALFNFSTQAQIARLNERETYTDLLSGETLTAEAVPLEARGFRWLVIRYDTEEV